MEFRYLRLEDASGGRVSNTHTSGLQLTASAMQLRRVGPIWLGLEALVRGSAYAVGCGGSSNPCGDEFYKYGTGIDIELRPRRAAVAVRALILVLLIEAAAHADPADRPSVDVAGGPHTLRISGDDDPNFHTGGWSRLTSAQPSSRARARPRGRLGPHEGQRSRRAL